MKRGEQQILGQPGLHVVEHVIISTLGKWRQEDQESFKTSLSNKANSRLPWKTLCLTRKSHHLSVKYKYRLVVTFALQRTHISSGIECWDSCCPLKVCPVVKAFMFFFQNSQTVLAMSGFLYLSGSQTYCSSCGEPLTIKLFHRYCYDLRVNPFPWTIFISVS